MTAGELLALLLGKRDLVLCQLWTPVINLVCPLRVVLFFIIYLFIFIFIFLLFLFLIFIFLGNLVRPPLVILSFFLFFLFLLAKFCFFH